MCNQLFELLKKWAELEPARCQVREDTSIRMRGPNFMTWSNFLKHEESQALVLFAVIASIATRQHRFKLEYSKLLGYQAEIQYLGQENGASRWFQACNASGSAIALLEAYLRLLEWLNEQKEGDRH